MCKTCVEGEVSEGVFDGMLQRTLEDECVMKVCTSECERVCYMNTDLENR